LRLRGKGYPGGDMYIKLNVKFQRPIWDIRQIFLSK
jgi:hypothetical protein